MVVDEIIATMSSINDSSKRIVGIIGIVDAIAFRTNILVLNVAVEAARAGEQGRGFALVATEVRSLAQRSATAAKEIKILIGDSVEKISSGIALVRHAGTTMQMVVNRIHRATEVMTAINTSSQEQKTGILEINRAVTQSMRSRSRTPRWLSNQLRLHRFCRIRQCSYRNRSPRLN